jgi:hypothetical protein
MLIAIPMASAQLAVSTNDNKVVQVNGVSTVVQNPPPDTVAIIDVKQFPPKILAEIDVPATSLRTQDSGSKSKVVQLPSASQKNRDHHEMA